MSENNNRYIKMTDRITWIKDKGFFITPSVNSNLYTDYLRCILKNLKELKSPCAHHQILTFGFKCEECDICSPAGDMCLLDLYRSVK